MTSSAPVAIQHDRETFAAPLEPETVIVASPTFDRIATMFVAVVPFLAVIYAGVLAWHHVLSATDLVICGVLYLVTGLGITAGFHRLLTHRAFACRPWLRFTFAALGSMAVEGPVVEWVANHRQHHAHSDGPGDPHSPHAHEGGVLRRLGHAHIGWVVMNSEVANERRYAPDLLEDRAIQAVDRTFVLWAVASLLVPFGLGYALTGTADGALTALLWGGAVRLFLLHQVTFSINSLCHFFGSAPYATGDHSRNLAWLSLFSFGESWHNNHHAFPTSAAHGLRRWQIDGTGLFISGLERLGLVWDVVRIDERRLAAKAL